MRNPNAEQLESAISSYINTVYKDVPPTEQELINIAEQLRNSSMMLMPVTNDEFNEIVLHLKQAVVFKMDVGVYINGGEKGEYQ